MWDDIVQWWLNDIPDWLATSIGVLVLAAASIVFAFFLVFLGIPVNPWILFIPLFFGGIIAFSLTGGFG